MKYYRWNISGNSCVVTTVSHDSRILTPYMDIEGVKSPIDLKLVEGDKTLMLNDFLYSGSSYIKILSEKAVNVVGSYLESSGKVLPVNLLGVETNYFAFKPFVSLDVLDVENSAIRETRHSRFVDVASFKERAVDHEVFLLTGFENLGCWVSQQFANDVSNSGLTGSKFVR